MAADDIGILHFSCDFGPVDVNVCLKMRSIVSRQHNFEGKVHKAFISDIVHESFDL